MMRGLAGASESRTGQPMVSRCSVIPLVTEPVCLIGGL